MAASVTGVSSVAGVPSLVRPRAATLLQWTIRSTPAACAARISALVPATLAASIASGSGTQMR